MLGEALVAVVLIPCDRIIEVRSQEDIHVAVPVHVDGEHGHSTICRVGDSMLGEALVAIVLIPCDRIIVTRNREDVHVAVPIHVYGEYGNATTR